MILGPAGGLLADHILDCVASVIDDAASSPAEYLRNATKAQASQQMNERKVHPTVRSHNNHKRSEEPEKRKSDEIRSGLNDGKGRLKSFSCY